MRQPEIENPQSLLSPFLTSWRWLVFSIILLFLGLVWIYISRIDQNKSGVMGDSVPFTGFEAPEFSLKSQTGETMSTLDYLGKPLVINLWASWCPPCRAEMPAMERIYQEYKDEGLEILAVNITTQDSKQEAVQFARDLGISFPILFDESGIVSQTYHLQALPTTFFIDEIGVIREVVIGGPMSETLLRTRVEDIINLPENR